MLGLGGGEAKSNEHEGIISFTEDGGFKSRAVTSAVRASAASPPAAHLIVNSTYQKHS